MAKVKVTVANEIRVKNIVGYFEKRVNRFGTGAKIDALKIYLGRRVIVLVLKD